MIASELRFSAPDSSHSTFSASRPCFAAQKPFATTATPRSTCTTDTTPGTAFAALASNDFTLPPKTGGRCSSATSMPGIDTSIVNCAVPSDFARASTRGTGLPISRKSLGDFSVTCSGTGSAAAAVASEP
ncbi:Uncharacterised protein [Burkholderia pseudomallei]|nr:Uncharacterised protein [Burkholderia pseudomallei]